MANCKECGLPIIKGGRSEHYLCRKFKKTIKKSSNVLELDSTDFNEACKALDRNPNLMDKIFLRDSMNRSI